MPKQFFDILILLLAFVAVLWGAQYVSKKIASMQFEKQKGKAMQLVEIISVAPGKMLQIIRVGERYFFIAVYKEGVRLLAELTAEDVKDMQEPTMEARVPFADYLKKIKEKVGHKNEK